MQNNNNTIQAKIKVRDDFQELADLLDVLIAEHVIEHNAHDILGRVTYSMKVDDYLFPSWTGESIFRTKQNLIDIISDISKIITNETITTKEN